MVQVLAIFEYRNESAQVNLKKFNNRPCPIKRPLPWQGAYSSIVVFDRNTVLK